MSLNSELVELPNCMCATVETPYIREFNHPTFNDGILISWGPINPYYKVDFSHPLLYGKQWKSLDPIAQHMWKKSWLYPNSFMRKNIAKHCHSPRMLIKLEIVPQNTMKMLKSI